MSTVTALTETLTCAACGHSLTTAKTIDKPDSLEVKCPKCQQQMTLGKWRTIDSPPVFIPEAKPQLAAVHTANDESFAYRLRVFNSEALSGLVQIFLFLIAACLGLVAIGASALVILDLFRPSSVFDLFHDDVAPGKTANVIQRVESELSIIRNLIIAIAFTKLTYFVIEKSQAKWDS